VISVAQVRGGILASLIAAENLNSVKTVSDQI
jgi:hypothetical protein